MSDIEAIKGRVRKLMTLANEGSASDGEIENAMRMAAALIDKHRLDVTELNRDEQDVAEQTMGMSRGKTESSKFHRWETVLAHAVAELFGCVKYYLSTEPVPLRVNGIVQYYTGRYAGQMKKCREVVFYGPTLEAQEAAELFSEWAHLIATMGVIRWGGAYRGDGEAYCQGFADRLCVIAMETNKSRAQLTIAAPKLLPQEQVKGSKALALIGGRNQIALRERYDVLKLRAAEWLKKDQGVKLSSGSKRQGTNVGSAQAYEEGAEHASEAGFGRKSPKKRLPPGGSK
jgi:hypothetical protein